MELQYDAMFKLTQCNNGDSIQKFLEITGSSGFAREKETVRSFVQIDAHFDKALFPEEIEKKDIEFGVDTNTCMNVLQKFRQRLGILNDDFAVISFKNNPNVAADQIQSSERFALQLKSKHMRTMATNRAYPGKAKDESNLRPKYKVQLKRDTFMKFFMILKLQGQGLMKMNHQQSIEMEYTLDKCPYLSLVLETAAR